MTREPRNYQIECRESVRAAFRRGLTGVCVELFTGAGKGYIIASISEATRANGKRVLCLVNRDNLCDQLFQSLCDQGLHPTMERGQEKASPLADMVVGSIQSMQYDRLQKWRHDHFALVITDEVHFAAADTFVNVLNHFRSAHHIGLTATIERHDKGALWDGYQDVVFRMPLSEGINHGWLVPLMIEALPVPIAISDQENGRKIFGDKQEIEIFARDSYLPRLFETSAAKCHNKRALMFWPGVKASETAAEHYRKAGIEARHIDGYMSKSAIAEILEWYKTPGNKTLHNADLLSYGYDNPLIDCVGIMRLSRSVPMLFQRIGRGTRTHPEAMIDRWYDATERKEAIAGSPKRCCQILDLMLQLGDVESRFADVGSLITNDKKTAEALRKARRAGVALSLDDMQKIAKARSEEADEKSLTKLAEDAGNAAARKASSSGPYFWHILRHHPRKHGDNDASEKQQGMLRRLGYVGPHDLNKQQAHLIIELFLKHAEKHAARKEQPELL